MTQKPKRDPYSREYKTEDEAFSVLASITKGTTIGVQFGWSDFRVEQLKNGRWVVTGVHTPASLKGSFPLNWKV